MNEYTGGTVPIARWQDRIAKRLGQLDAGRYMIVFDMPQAGTIEPTWCILEMGKVENVR